MFMQKKNLLGAKNILYSFIIVGLINSNHNTYDSAFFEFFMQFWNKKVFFNRIQNELTHEKKTKCYQFF